MATTMQATQFLKSVYREVWQCYSSKAFSKYYDQKLTAYSAGSSFNFEEFYDLLDINREKLKCMRSEFHRVVPHQDNQLSAWFTTTHYHHNDKEAYRIHTMANYTVKNDKIINVEFMWDKPVELIVGYKAILPKITNPVNGKKLSRRELQCFFYLLQGRTAKEIAAILQISFRTIETHIANIKNKLDLTNARDITEFAITNGYLALAPIFNNILSDI